MERGFDGAQRLDGHQYPDTIIHGFGNEPVPKLAIGPVERSNIANPYGTIFRIDCADVNIDFIERGHLIDIIQLIVSDHALRSVQEADATAEYIFPKHAADRRKTDKSIFIYMADNHANLVHMGG